MSDTIRIKRRVSGAPGAPASLANAELAYNEVSDVLFYGKGGSATAAASIVPIAGSGAFQPLDGDLTALSALTGVNVIYYRSAANTWAAVTIGTGLSFSAGTLSATGGGGTGNVSNVGTPTAGQLAAWTDATHIQGIAPSSLGFEASANKGVANGYASLDASAKVPAAQLPSYVDDVVEYVNLAAFPATGTTGVIYVALDTGKIYRWSGSAYVEISPSPGSTDAVPEGAVNLYYTEARVSANATVVSKAPLASPALTGNPTAPTPATADNDTSIATTAFVKAQGYITSAALTSYAPLASPTFTGDPKAPTPSAGDNDTSIATTAFVTGAISTAGAGYQPLDADLTSLAAVSGTNTIYYRSAADTWSPVNVSTGLAFSGGNLTATAGGGNVSNSGTPAANELAQWVTATTIKGLPISTHRTAATFYGTTSFRNTVATPANGIDVVGAAAAATPDISAIGSDTNIGLNYRAKGTGTHNFYSHGTTLQAQIGNVAGASTYVRIRGAVGQGILDAVGGGMLNIIDANLSGAPIAVTPTPATDSSTKVATTAFVRIGVTDGSAAAAGQVGECIEAQIAHSTLTLTSGVGLAVISIPLTAGDWEVAGAVHFTCGGITSTSNLFAGLSATSGSVATVSSHGWGSCTGFASAGFMTAVVSPTRVSLATSQTWYVNALSTFTGTVTVGGRIHARRVR